MTTLAAEAPAAARLPELTRLLRAAHPDARCELNFDNPLQLLVATILSAQCTDVRVNMTTPALFEKYPHVLAFAEAERAELEQAIRSTGFYRQKARFIQKSAQQILSKHGGSVPADMRSLTALTGVARKTANVVLGTGFGIADGVVVDTHVKRLSNRLRLTSQQNPEKIEKDLMALVPRNEWVAISHLLIFHGRRVCNARKPNCAACTLNHLCPSSEV